MDFDETWYAWVLNVPYKTIGFFFGQIRPGAGPGQGKNRS